MKSIKIITLKIILLTFLISNSTTKDNEIKIPSNIQNKKDEIDKVKVKVTNSEDKDKLFKSDDRRICKFNERTYNNFEKTKQSKGNQNDKNTGSTWGALPIKKENIYEKKLIGWGLSSYLFDFLDGVLLEPIVTEFTNIWDQAVKIKKSIDISQEGKNFKDPYSLETIFGLKSTKTLLIKKMKKINPKFDEKIYLQSLSLKHINIILRRWKWKVKGEQNDMAKNLLDKFDFNGDERLSKKEFIIAMIRTNKSILGKGICENCLENIITKKIDRIFLHLDCHMTSTLNAETIWDYLIFLNRGTDKGKYDFYQCKYKGNKTRTSVVNDFILKAQKNIEGFVTKQEWRLAILQGYWSRQVSDLEILKGDRQSMRYMRWANGKDVVCETMKEEMNSISRPTSDGDMEVTSKTS